MNISMLKACTQSLCKSASHRKDVVERAAKIYNYSPTKTKVKKVTGGIAGYVAPVLKKIKAESQSLGALTEGYSAVSRNVKIAKRAAKRDGTSTISATIKGVKDSKGAITHSLGELVGVNDVMMAKEHAGTVRAVLEGGKSAFRLISSGALSAACLPVPIPGAVVGGWFAGEKLAEKLLGKPFSKQIAKLK